MSVLVLSRDGIKTLVKTEVLPNNEIYINKESDFPVQDATTITLQDNFAYVIGASFTTTKRFICGNSTIRAGNSTNVMLTYTGTDPMFTVTNNKFRIERIQLDCPNAYVVRINGTNTGNVNERVNIVSSVIDNCVGFIDFNQAGASVVFECQVQNVTGTEAFKVVGSNIVILSVDKLFVGGLVNGAKGVDFTTSTTNEIEFENTSIFGNAGATALSGLTNNGNLTSTGFATVNNCNFESFTTPLSGISANDSKWFFTFNSDNVPESVRV